MARTISVIIVAFLLFSGCCQGEQTQTNLQEKGYFDITVYELMQKIEEDGEFVLLDVRTTDEYAQGHIKGAILIPYTEIEEKYKELGCPCQEVVVYCKSGYRSTIASKSLVKLGFGNVKNLLGGIQAWKKAEGKVVKGGSMEGVKLPAIQVKGKVSLEEALAKRRSRRGYKDEPLSLKEVAQLLWAAQGITAEWGGRTAPSAGATYPLEVYLVAGKVEGLKPGLYHYLPKSHSLVKIMEGDFRKELADAALSQRMILKAPITLVVAAEFRRTTAGYGERGTRYVHMEVGHVGENIYLQAEALGLATVAVGAFRDEAVKEVLKLEEEPLYLMPVGKPR